MLRASRSASQFPILFGGMVTGTILTLTEFLGTTTNGLRELTVRPGSGAGGRAVAAQSLVAVSDYRNAPSITHDYDAPVLAEGIRSVMAAPIVVDGTTRMVAYAATRSPVSWGDLAQQELLTAADALAREIALRDEWDRRISLVEGAMAEREIGHTQTVEAVSLELRELAAAVDDPAIATRLRAASRRLDDSRPTGHAPAVSLTPREIDVLRLVSYGLTYAEVALELELRPATVKSYMKGTIAKLGTRNRHHAVVEARLQGLLT
jgi:Response regulator containing a CheY-like receiver domain and an HTH DNA-binding domain